MYNGFSKLNKAMLMTTQGFVLCDDIESHAEGKALIGVAVRYMPCRP